MLPTFTTHTEHNKQEPVTMQQTLFSYFAMDGNNKLGASCINLLFLQIALNLSYRMNCLVKTVMNEAIVIKTFSDKTVVIHVIANMSLNIWSIL